MILTGERWLFKVEGKCDAFYRRGTYQNQYFQITEFGILWMAEFARIQFFVSARWL